MICITRRRFIFQRCQHKFHPLSSRLCTRHKRSLTYCMIQTGFTGKTGNTKRCKYVRMYVCQKIAKRRKICIYSPQNKINIEFCPRINRLTISDKPAYDAIKKTQTAPRK